jgi:hypothetical protein
MSSVRVCHLEKERGFRAFCEDFGTKRPRLQFGRFEVRGCETLTPELGGMKLFWIYEGEGEVFLGRGFRTKEGDGQRLPQEYVPEPLDPRFGERLEFLSNALDRLTPSAQGPVQSILSRFRHDTYIGDFANDLWALEHSTEPWSPDLRVIQTIRYLFLVYRERGFSKKIADSYERVMIGDQLAVSGSETLAVRGRFSCLTLECAEHRSRHVPAATRLRYLKDTSGGCNFDFDPFRRLPMTWQVKLPGETGDGVNFVNSHVVNIAKETSPTHFHPPKAVGGGDPQEEIYLVLNPGAYGLKTYGRQASLIAYPDLRDLDRFEQHNLEPGHFVFIPAGIGHRGIDVFVNVITLPGFKPHNEYYIDKDLHDMTQGQAPYNENLLGIKNYERIEDLL